MSKLNSLDMIALVLVIVGGINWGLVGLGYNLVDSLFGMSFARLIYILVGLAAIYMAVNAMKLEKK